MAIGCCFTLPPENPDTNGVRFRSEQRPASLRAVTCLGLFDGLSVRPFQATSFHHHTAVPRPKRAAGVQCRHCHRPAGNFVAATNGVNESRTPSGTAPGARAEPVKPCPAFTLSGGPAPSREAEEQGNCGCAVRLFRPRQGNFVSKAGDADRGESDSSESCV